MNTCMCGQFKLSERKLESAKTGRSHLKRKVRNLNQPKRLVHRCIFKHRSLLGTLNRYMCQYC